MFTKKNKPNIRQINITFSKDDDKKMRKKVVCTVSRMLRMLDICELLEVIFGSANFTLKKIYKHVNLLVVNYRGCYPKYLTTNNKS